MTVAAASGVASTPTSATAAVPPKKQLDGEAFLQLLVTQLRNQDPTAPMDSNELMAQQTQLASMEQLTALSQMTGEAFALQMRVASASLIGQQVSWVEDDVTHSGTVSAVSYTTSPPTVSVDGKNIPLDVVSAVSTKTA